jgi:hypothetical protein
MRPIIKTFEGRAHMAMNRLSRGIFAAVQLAATWMAVAQTGTDPGSAHQAPIILANNHRAMVPSDDATSPAISISARILDFGSVPVGSSNELSFMVQNVGAHILTVGASVSPPFSVRSNFVLQPAQTQVITVRYAPNSAGMHMTVVHLTGAGQATVTITGSAAPLLPQAPARRRVPTRPKEQGPRLLASR